MSQTPVSMYRYTKQFSCLLDRCPDTCCHGAWGMQVGQDIVEKMSVQAPELLNAIESDHKGGHMMSCHASGTCRQYENGLCSIHAKHGEAFLGDACYFYPRITRSVAGQPLMMAAMSCPETARLILFSDNPFERETDTIERLPSFVRDITPKGWTDEQMLMVMDSFTAVAADDSVSLHLTIQRLLSLGLSLDQLPQLLWLVALPFYSKSVDDRLIPLPGRELDSGLLIKKILGLLHLFVHVKSHKSSQILYEQLEAIVANYSGDALWQDLHRNWLQFAGEQGDVMLRRWLQGVLVMDNFPFAGLGDTPSTRIRMVVLRYNVMRTCLLLLTYQNQQFPDNDTVIRVVYSIARIFDHLTGGAFLVDAAKDLGLYQMEELLAYCRLETPVEMQMFFRSG